MGITRSSHARPVRISSLGQILNSTTNRLRGCVAWRYKSLRDEVDATYMKSLRRSEYLDESQLKELQWHRLIRLLQHAYETVPFYRTRMDESGLKPNHIQSPDDLRKLPILTKKDIRTQQKQLISTEFPVETLYANHSGGSTGEPLHFYLDERRRRMGTTDAMWFSMWSGWRIGDPIAYLWGAPENPPKTHWARRLFRERVLSPGFFVDAYTLNDEKLHGFVQQYNKWSPTLIVGYAMALRELADFLLAEGIRLDPPPKAVISSAELLARDSARVISDAIGCPVMDRYGCREVSLIAGQCPASHDYHVNINRIFLEILSDDDDQAEPADGQPGRVIVTDLEGYGMPLIRYELGDRASRSESSACNCGWKADRIAAIEGRTADFLLTADNKKVHGLYFNILVWDVPEIERYCLVQESYELITLSYIEKTPVPTDKLDGLRLAIQKAIDPDVRVELSRVDTLPKTRSGKHKYIESRIVDKQTMHTDTE